MLKEADRARNHAIWQYADPQQHLQLQVASALAGALHVDDQLHSLADGVQGLTIKLDGKAQTHLGILAARQQSSFIDNICKLCS